MPRVSLAGALSHEVCVFNLPTLPKVWPFMVQCMFMHCSTRGWPLRKRCAQRLCKGLPTKKNHTVMYSVWYCVMFVFFFLLNKQFSSSSSSSSSSTTISMAWKKTHLCILEMEVVEVYLGDTGTPCRTLNCTAPFASKTRMDAFLALFVV